MNYPSHEAINVVDSLILGMEFAWLILAATKQFLEHLNENFLNIFLKVLPRMLRFRQRDISLEFKGFLWGGRTDMLFWDSWW